MAVRSAHPRGSLLIWEEESFQPLQAAGWRGPGSRVRVCRGGRPLQSMDAPGLSLPGGHLEEHLNFILLAPGLPCARVLRVSFIILTTVCEANTVIVLILQKRKWAHRSLG